jgi:hypothetical protein
MTTKTAKPTQYRLDFNNLLPLTEEQKAELEALTAQPDSEIDFSDIPEVTEERTNNAVTKTKMVSYTLDTLPPMTDARFEELKALAARPDSEIDFSDSP